MMRKLGFKCFVAALAVSILPIASSFATPPTATPKASPPWPSHVPPVPRAIPDLIPYWNFDPPKSSLFNLNNLTVSGDLRVRPEFRSNGTFGLTKRNDNVVQQWMRLGINYSVSPDIDIFIQPQYAKNWGANGVTAGGTGQCGASICANDAFHVNAGDSFFVRQAYVILRNAGVPNLSFKLGRQLIVYGNHRLFGHFDWANTGFSHDAATFNYTQPKWNIAGGYARAAESDFSTAAAGGAPDNFPLAVPGLDGPNANANADASDDADFFFLRAQLKPFAGLSIEPLYVWFRNGGPSNGAAAGVTQAHAPNQSRHTLGARGAWSGGLGPVMKADLTAEGYWQTGSQGVLSGNTNRDLSINAWAGNIAGGITFVGGPRLAAMQPRIGLEFNGASGDGDATTCTTSATCNGTANTFENLYPTNHILMGYMDLFAWRNMIGYSANFKIKPTPASHVEIAGWIFRRQTNGDNWYRAAQNVYFAHRPGITTSDSLGQEIDIIYTHFFMGGKVAWQLGYGHFFPGEFVEQTINNSAAGGPIDPVGQDWGYTQIHVNF